MSYDICLVDADGESILIDDSADLEFKRLYPTRSSHSFDGVYWNLTYNVAPMLGAADFGFRDVAGWKASDAGPVIREALQRMLDDPERFKALNPPNGWGDYDGTIAVMAGLAAHCALNPDATLRVT